MKTGGYMETKKRPVTTLFMLSSVDGKISTGAADELDFDRDFPRVPGVREGLQQYYDIEQTTDLWSLNSGRVQAKMGVNEKAMPEKTGVSFVLIDNRHLTEHGVAYFCARSRQMVLVTSNSRHPAFQAKAENLRIIFQPKLDLAAMLEQLKAEFGCQRVTIQTGGTLNGLFLREKLLDYVDIVVAPVLIGGGAAPTLIDGEPVASTDRLSELGVLELESAQSLKHSYVRLRYKVVS